MFWKSICVHVAAGPLRHRARLEVLERLEAEVAHPLRLVLVRRDLLDHLAVEALLGLEGVALFGVVEAVLVAVLDAREVVAGQLRLQAWPCSVEPPA